MNSWVFIFWVITQYYYIYFIGQIVPALTTNSSLSWLLCFFDIFHHCILFYVFGHLLTQLDAFIFPVPILARAVLPRILGSFFWRLVLETKIWVVDALVTAGMIGVLLLLRRASQVTQCKESTCRCMRLKRLRSDHWVRKIPWRRKWQPAPVFSPGRFHGQRSLAGYSPWGHKELDIAELLSTHTLLLSLFSWKSKEIYASVPAHA